MIHLFKQDGRFEIWTDTEVGPRDGRCLAVHERPQEALRIAIQDLETDLKVLRHLQTTEIT
jgi:hypothetical protein